MPLQRCQRNNEEGWQGFPSGKCYIPSEEGSDEAAKQAAIDQAVAAGVDPENYQEYADFLGVPIFKANSRKGWEITDDMLDNIAYASNACLDYIKHSIDTQTYYANPHLETATPIPALINLNHQDHALHKIDPDTHGNNYFRDVAVKYYTKLIGGVKWLCADFKGLTQAAAKVLQEDFPSRSIELLRKVRNPLDAQDYEYVIRSTSFLDRWTPPAIKGQPDYVAEYADGVLLRIHSNIEEDQNMAENDVKKYEELKAKYEALTEKLQAQKEAISEKEQELSAYQELEQEFQSFRQNTANEIARRDLEKWQDQLVMKYHLAQVPGNMLELALSLDNEAVQKYGEVEKSQRQAFMEFCDSVFQAAAQNTLSVPVGKYADAPQKQQTVSKEEAQKQIIDQHMAKFQEAGLSEREAFLKAYDAILADPKDKHLFE